MRPKTNIRLDRPRVSVNGEELSAADLLRLIVRNMNSTNENINSQFTVTELLAVYTAQLKSDWDFYPDQWTEQQIAEAKIGIAPDWDDNEKPVFAADRWTKRLVQSI